MYITSQNFKNTILFQVTFTLVMNWIGNMISLCSPFFGISWKRNALKSWSFLSFHNISFNFFTGKSLLKQQNTLHTQIIIWHLGVLTMQKFIDIALVVFKIFKVVKPKTFPMKFDTKQAWCKWGQRKQWSCLSNKFL